MLVRCLARVSPGAMAMRALVMPKFFALRDHRRVLQQRCRDRWRWVALWLRFSCSRCWRLSHHALHQTRPQRSYQDDNQHDRTQQNTPQSLTVGSSVEAGWRRSFKAVLRAEPLGGNR
jgi:hypothetical protein